MFLNLARRFEPSFGSSSNLSHTLHESLHMALIILYWSTSSKYACVSSWYQYDPTLPSFGSDGNTEKSLIILV
uniref:Uncharacterized protein n=1 Tax=Rhizophora mucronata TaxID=61149 RepID=A0A2P2KRS3_RHIMU